VYEGAFILARFTVPFWQWRPTHTLTPKPCPDLVMTNPRLSSGVPTLLHVHKADGALQGGGGCGSLRDPHPLPPCNTVKMVCTRWTVPYKVGGGCGSLKHL
jgi:hypothetical protein